MSQSASAANQTGEETAQQRLQSHWHYTMVIQTMWGLCDVRAALSVVFCLINFFGWWEFKCVLLGTTFVGFGYLEQRQVAPEVAIRQFIAWLRGPLTPNIATKDQTWLGYQPHPKPLPARLFVNASKRKVA